MRIPRSPRLRRCAILLLLLCCGGQAHAEVASCPQADDAEGLPPLSFDPKILLRADHAQLQEGGISMLSGSVIVSQAGREFAAQAMRYDEKTRVVYTESESRFRNLLITVRSQTARYELDTDRGVFGETLFTLPALASRGSAERIEIRQQNEASLQRVHYSSCSPEHEAWSIDAREIRINRATSIGTSRDTVLRFAHVPVLWLPYFRFPLSDARESGFLLPTFGDEQTTGLDLRAPYYLNLAPNYDATLTPRYMSRRGLALGVDSRFLSSHSEGTMHTEYLPDDQVTGNSRHYVDFSEETRINHRLGFSAHFADVSDPSYFGDFGGKYDAVSTPYLERSAELTYQAPTQYRIVALAQDFQPLSGLTDQQNPYARLPALLFSGATKNRLWGIGAGMAGDFSNFHRSDSVNGQRLYADPYLRWETDHAGWFAAAQSDLTYTAYKLSGPLDGAPADPRRTLPEFSLDSGLRFERETASGGLQTLEPRLFYVYVPYREQSQLPLFDSGQPDFDFPQLFSLNRYSGEDRISDASQLTTAVTTRVIDPTLGIPRVTATFGEVYRFTAPRVTLPGENGPDRGTSDYVADVEYAITKRISAATFQQWSPDSGDFDRSAVGLRYNGAGGVRADISYRFLRDSFSQTDTSLSAPIGHNWRVAGRLRYSFQENQVLDSFAGLEYENCCWAIQASYRRYLTGVDHYNDGVLVQLELKGLTQLGKGFNRLLPRQDD